MGCFGSKAEQAKVPGSAPLNKDQAVAKGSKGGEAQANPKPSASKPVEIRANIQPVAAKTDPPRGKPASKPVIVPSIPLISKGKLQLFHCPNQRWKPAVALQGEVAVAEGSTLVYLSESSLFLIEARSKHTSEIALGNGAVTPICDLATPRLYCGAIAYDKAIYLFGGCEGPIAEKCTLSTRSAQGLPNMLNSRSHFVPCLWENRVFLCGGRTIAAEMYLIDENRYYLCGFTVPDSGDCLAVFNDTSVLILSVEFISRWDVASEELSVQARAQKSECWSSAPGVWVGDSVFVEVAGEILRVDLRTTAHFVLSPPNRDPEILSS